jgi:uncharacterized zinc-type alcohol dehydrogenase-like protein
MIPAKSYAAYDPQSPLRPYDLERREPGPTDVVIAIAYCGICHSDLHFVHNDLKNSTYPLVPGHEIVGTVQQVGSAVTSFKPGDTVGVGCMVNACLTCAACKRGEEQYCENGFVGTYGADDRDGTRTQGGYSTVVTVDENFVLRIPEGMPLDRTAPLLCAGITTYSPLRTWGAGPGKKVAVIGLGGLGHMAVKLAAAMGADVTVISTSDRKKADAMAMGAKDFLISKDEAAMTAARGRFDLIINTVSATHDVNRHLGLLDTDGTMVLLGLTTEPMPVSAIPLILGRRRLAGSVIGGIAETQEMLDFCAQHGITSDIELIPADRINEAYARVEKSDVRYRFVIDTATMA